ncbi:MAG TPA: molybdenum cofactor guanylyltransferase [Myxococcales bacterium]|nr:molybdenum cofactor guanylyltransferase [Myxococcales bacterium]
MRDASAIALAGGRSERFGSDKALADFRGAPLLLAVVGALRAEFPEVLVVAKRAEPYAASGARVVLDRAPLYTPLSGLEAGLAAASRDVVFCCAADMPFAVDALLLDALFAALSGHDAAVPVHAGARQPLCALYRRDPCLAAASALLAKSAVGPKRLLDSVRTAFVEWPDERPFLDADTREQLAKLDR